MKSLYLYYLYYYLFILFVLFVLLYNCISNIQCEIWKKLQRFYVKRFLIFNLLEDLKDKVNLIPYVTEFGFRSTKFDFRSTKFDSRSTKFDSRSTKFGSLITKFNSISISKFHFGSTNIELYMKHEIRILR